MRIALAVEYDGSAYHGWQRQIEVDSVQQQLEKSLSIVANHPIEVQCAGRTDTGVHGTGQIVHFDTDAKRAPQAWTLGVNSNLPLDIAVHWAKPVSSDFHARFSAIARRYRYIIHNGRYRPAILAKGLSHYHKPLDAQRMHEAGARLIGEHDFTSFRALHCQSKTPRRTIHHLIVTRIGDYIVVDIKANAFLHHMVRNIVGNLIKIGLGEKEAAWLDELIAIRDRAQAAATAKAGGLYLVDVDYPKEFELPKLELGPLFVGLP
ncbi:tRNA pseudouridine(38-40) synthase TruA [Alginatibacterium sediminis]|uniref:tRNA pseudouridine synthase A n=1 Tax=Alginatibacterium sediminis TaxID=2164068 RepID=A0A420EG10_9ALTE|nr:tRNA pseudouridine(38-40) synthase TruA [Alginatibacterium sediminis]RKF19600.1 tRNA pseudouridine(38-40) synthase TruA [Alginatibacterium sediminis]